MAETRYPVTNRPMAAGQPISTMASLTPRDFFIFLRRHVFLIIIMTFLGIITGVTSWYLLRKYYPRYTAQTYIKVLSPETRDPLSIVSGVVSREAKYDHRLTLASLIMRESNLSGLISRGAIKGTNWYKQFGASEAKRIQGALEDLQNTLIADAQRNTDFISVSMTCEKPEEAALIVNEAVNMFLISQGINKTDELTAQLAKFNQQKDNFDKDLATSERLLNDIRSSPRWGFTDFERTSFQDAITLRVQRLDDQADELSLQINQLQADVNNLQRLVQEPIGVQVEEIVERDSVMVMLAQQRDSIKSQMAGLLSKFGEDHSIIRQIQEQLDEIEQRREDRKLFIGEQRRQANLKNAQDHLVTLVRQLEDLTKRRQEAAAKKAELERVRVQYENEIKRRDELKNRIVDIDTVINNLKLQIADPETPKVQAIGDAPVPQKMSFPRLAIFAPSGTFLGLALGIGLVFLIELLNDLIRTPRDVAKYLHIPLLGVIPDISEDNEVEGIEPFHIVKQAPFSIISESYRRLRTNLKLFSTAQTSKSILITSGNPKEGKTFLAANLAETFIADGKKVLIVDTNLWQPKLESIFPGVRVLENNHQETNKYLFGLSDYLKGKCDDKDVIRSSGVEGLDVIVCGAVSSASPELLGTSRMKELIERQREHYDYIILDGPPSLIVSDAKMLARFVDGLILVFNADKTRRGAVQRTIREFREVNVTIIGSVLVAAKAMKGGYFSEQFRSYQTYKETQLVQTA